MILRHNTCLIYRVELIKHDLRLRFVHGDSLNWGFGDRRAQKSNLFRIHNERDMTRHTIAYSLPSFDNAAEGGYPSYRLVRGLDSCY